MKKPEPLIIIKDTRESNFYIYQFKSAEFKDKVLLVRNKLDCGDFSVCGHDADIMIERKTVSDLCISFTGNRDRFEAEWKRAQDYSYKYLLIEGDFNEIVAGEYRSDVHPNSLVASLMSWSLKYNFSWFCVPNSASGQAAVYWLLRNYKRLVEDKEITP